MYGRFFAVAPAGAPPGAHAWGAWVAGCWHAVQLPSTSQQCPLYLGFCVYANFLHSTSTSYFAVAATRLLSNNAQFDDRKRALIVPLRVQRHLKSFGHSIIRIGRRAWLSAQGAVPSATPLSSCLHLPLVLPRQPSQAKLQPWGPRASWRGVSTSLAYTPSSAAHHSTALHCHMVGAHASMQWCVVPSLINGPCWHWLFCSTRAEAGHTEAAGPLQAGNPKVGLQWSRGKQRACYTHGRLITKSSICH